MLNYNLHFFKSNLQNNKFKEAQLMRPKYKIVDEYVFYFLNAISR